jgi:hypothetical protein
MSDNDDLPNISDTARWVAIYRAIESERPDAVATEKSVLVAAVDVAANAGYASGR